MTTWKPWTPEEVAEWERKALAGELWKDTSANPEYVAKPQYGSTPRLPIVVEGVEHGTVRGYALDKCRCKPCADAAAPYLASLGVSL